MATNTKNFNFKKPDESDFYSIQDQNGNWDKTDEALGAMVTAAGGDISDTRIATADTVTAEFPVPEAGDTVKGFLGKMKKFCADFKGFKDGVITLGKLVNNGTCAEAGFALDARYGKTLHELYAQLNRDLAYKTVAVNKNDTTVKDSYSTGYQQSGIGVLNVDVYMKPETVAFTDYEILYTGFRPSSEIGLNVVNTANKLISVTIKPSGTIILNTREASGEFNLRLQMVLALDLK